MTPRDKDDSNPAEGRQKHGPVPVTRDKKTEPRDKDLSPGDRDEQPTRQTNESRYGAASAATPPPQPGSWTPGSNYAVHLTLTRPDLVATTPEQREQLVTVFTSMILDFLQRQRTERTRPD